MGISYYEFGYYKGSYTISDEKARELYKESYEWVVAAIISGNKYYQNINDNETFYDKVQESFEQIVSDVCRENMDIYDYDWQHDETDGVGKFNASFMFE